MTLARPIKKKKRTKLDLVLSLNKSGTSEQLEWFRRDEKEVENML